MKKYEAIGVVETLYFAVALEMLDEMLKTSNVEFISKESTLGGKLVTLFVGGSISEVKNSISHRGNALAKLTKEMKNCL